MSSSGATQRKTDDSHKYPLRTVGGTSAVSSPPFLAFEEIASSRVNGGSLDVDNGAATKDYNRLDGYRGHMESLGKLGSSSASSRLFPTPGRKLLKAVGQAIQVSFFSWCACPFDRWLVVCLFVCVSYSAPVSLILFLFVADSSYTAQENSASLHRWTPIYKNTSSLSGNIFALLLNQNRTLKALFMRSAGNTDPHGCIYPPQSREKRFSKLNLPHREKVGVKHFYRNSGGKRPVSLVFVLRQAADFVSTNLRKWGHFTCAHVYVKRGLCPRRALVGWKLPLLWDILHITRHACISFLLARGS